MAGSVGSAFKFWRSATSRMSSSSSSRFFPVLAETSTVGVSPPQSSACRPRSASSRFTRSGFTPGLSILLIATMIGTLAALVWEIDFSVLYLHLVSADMLCNSSGLLLGHTRFANGVQQRRLSMVNVAHDGNDRG